MNKLPMRLWCVNAEASILSTFWKARTVGGDVDLLAYDSVQDRGGVFVLAATEADAIQRARGLQRAKRLLDHVQSQNVRAGGEEYAKGFAAALTEVSLFAKRELAENDLSTERLIGVHAQWQRILEWIARHMPTLAILAMFFGGLPCLTGCSPAIESSSDAGGAGGSGGGVSNVGGSRGTSGGSELFSSGAITSSSGASPSLSSTSTGGGGSFEGSGGSSDGGAGGAPSCETCASSLMVGGKGPICEPSVPAADALIDCAADLCGFPCDQIDNPGSPESSPACSACLDTNCAVEITACEAQ